MKNVITSTREPRNKAEYAVWSTLRSEGWTVIRKGWPDFACFRQQGEVEESMVVEVKPQDWYALRKEQRKIMQWLQSLGVRTMRGNKKGFLIPFNDSAEDLKMEEPEWMQDRTQVGEILKRMNIFRST